MLVPPESWIHGLALRRSACHDAGGSEHVIPSTENLPDGKMVFENSCDLELSGLVAGDSAICGRLAALILRLRPAGLRFEEFRSLVERGGLGLRFSNRSGLRPAAI